MSDLSDLYQEVILDHNRRPRNFRALPDASHTAEGYNPLCGDRLTLYLKVADGVISSEEAEDLLLIAAIWVNPAARDPELVYQNNRAATRKALENGATGAPKLDEILAARHEPANPFFTAGLSRTDRVSSDSFRTEHVR